MFNMKNITRRHNYKFLKDPKSIAKKTQGKRMVGEGTKLRYQRLSKKGWQLKGKDPSYKIDFKPQ